MLTSPHARQQAARSTRAWHSPLEVTFSLLLALWIWQSGTAPGPIEILLWLFWGGLLITLCMFALPQFMGLAFSRRSGPDRWFYLLMIVLLYGLLYPVTAVALSQTLPANKVDGRTLVSSLLQLYAFEELRSILPTLKSNPNNWVQVVTGLSIWGVVTTGAIWKALHKTTDEGLLTSAMGCLYTGDLDQAARLLNLVRTGSDALWQLRIAHQLLRGEVEPAAALWRAHLSTSATYPGNLDLSALLHLAHESCSWGVHPNVKERVFSLLIRQTPSEEQFVLLWVATLDQRRGDPIYRALLRIAAKANGDAQLALILATTLTDEEVLAAMASAKDRSSTSVVVNLLSECVQLGRAPSRGDRKQLESRLAAIQALLLALSTRVRDPGTAVLSVLAIQLLNPTFSRAGQHSLQAFRAAVAKLHSAITLLPNGLQIASALPPIADEA